MDNRRTRVLIIGVGNLARGDDGLAPRLLDSLREAGYGEHWWLTLMEDAQLQVEHALDLQLNDVALFVDASVDAPAPYSLREIHTPEGHRMVMMSHELAPQDVLHTLATIGRRAVPPSFLLAIRGEHFELGETLSTAAAEHLDAATHLLEQLLAEPAPEAWRRLAEPA